MQLAVAKHHLKRHDLVEKQSFSTGLNAPICPLICPHCLRIEQE